MHRSKLRTIQLVSLCPSIHVKTYGLNNVLFPLLEDLKVLERDGIKFSKDGMLPLMVGRLVPIGCPAWHVLLLLLDVVEYCTSPEVTPALSMFLSDLINDFLTSYFAVFPDVSMKPKFHYLIHYPQMLLQFGPLINT
ncbi:hypothetical protein HOLleu_01478 [Holothuria leucospilota]|uniref:Uncharacterized protein n=1 Tax=Holothuria leucospilota TaxID=206669 RepID=A0A9Q1HGG1_HOLLE|nr:hypothetical protein HOLleu_01478 [Holothuria leucospilota]